MNIIRDILVLTFNTDWGKDIKDAFADVKKAKIDICSMRSIAVKKISEKNYAAVIIEDTFLIKNINFILRAFLSQNHSQPEVIIFSFIDFSLYKQIDFPEGLKSHPHAISGPVNPSEIKETIKRYIFHLGETEIGGPIDGEFFGILMSATKQTLEGLGIFKEIEFGETVLSSSMEQAPVWAISGKIIIKSDFFSGSLFFSFPKKTYMNIYNETTGSNASEIEDGNADYAGEIANMIYGHTKKILEKQGIQLDMAIPITDRSSDLESKHPVYIIPVQSSLGGFWIKLAINYF